MSSTETTKHTIHPAFVWIGFGLLFFVLMLRAINAYDIWFLLLAGQYTLDHMAVPHHEFYLYTAMGQPDLFGGWGYGLIMDLVRRIGGMPGLSFLNAALWSGFFLTMIMATRYALQKNISDRFSPKEIICFIISCMFVFASILPRTCFRPEVTLYIIWAIGLIVFEKDRRNNNFKTSLWIFPMLAWIEAWFHTAGPILLLLPATYAAEHCYYLYQQKTLQPTFRSIYKTCQPWLLSLCATMVLPCFNPNGIEQVYSHVGFLLEQLGLTDKITPALLPSTVPGEHLYNVEYLPAWLNVQNRGTYIFLSITTLVTLINTERKIHSILSIIPIAAFGILHSRGLGLWGMTLIMPLATQFNLIWESIERRLASSPNEASSYFIFPSMIGLLYYTIYIGAITLPVTTVPFSASAQAIKNAYPNGTNVFAESHLGAVLYWSLGSHYLVSNGAHVMTPYPETQRHYVAVMRAHPDWQEELRKYNVNALVVRTTDYITAVPPPILRHINIDKSWILVDKDPEAFTYVKNPPQTPLETASERVQSLQTLWSTVHKKAKQMYLDVPFPLTKATIKLSEARLDLLNDTTLSPEDILTKYEHIEREYLAKKDK
jgi:hypothetical protein